MHACMHTDGDAYTTHAHARTYKHVGFHVGSLSFTVRKIGCQNRTERGQRLLVVSWCLVSW